MSAKRKKYDSRQSELPLTRDVRLTSLRQIDRDRLTDPETDAAPGKRAWARVVDLLTQVELCGMRDGCYAYAETLAARMDGKLGVSKTTLWRAQKLAARLGLLQWDNRYNGQGQASNQWFVNWTKVAALGGRVQDTGGARAAVASVDGGRSPDIPVVDFTVPETERHPFQTETHPFQTETHPNRNNPSSVSSVEDGSTCREADEVETNDETTLDIALGFARLLVRKVGPLRSDHDRSLAAKSALLAATKLSEDWLWDAVAGVNRRESPPRKPWAYLHKCLEEGAEERGKNFRRLLAKTTIPDRMKRNRTRPTVPDERLCAVSDD